MPVSQKQPKITPVSSLKSLNITMALQGALASLVACYMAQFSNPFMGLQRRTNFQWN